VEQAVSTTNALRDALDNGRTCRGIVFKIGSPDLVEIAARSGLDFVIIDLEHSPIGFETAAAMIRAGECAGCPVLVRAPSTTSEAIGPILDLGVDGIIAPMVNSRVEAEMFSRAVHYPPFGLRGASPTARAAHYSLLRADNVPALLNDRLQVWVIIETPEALDDIDGIAGTPGIDVLWLGLYDLALRFGVPPPSPSLLHPALADALELVLASAARHGLHVAASGAIPEVSEWARRGGALFYMGTDVSLFVNACRVATSDFQTSPEGGRK